jgi:hypothetical protein
MTEQEFIDAVTELGATDIRVVHDDERAIGVSLKLPRRFGISHPAADKSAGFSALLGAIRQQRTI